MNKNQAIADIRKIFSTYKSLTAADRRLLAVLRGRKGKLYELYVLAQLVVDLRQRGFKIRFHGTSLKFKASPGAIKLSDPHFVVSNPGSSKDDFRIFVDIEFETKGYAMVKAADLSQHHELDIVVTTAQAGHPKPGEVALGVECKAYAKFDKSLVKEALGIRRELSLLEKPRPSVLSAAGGKPLINVPAEPRSEFWLAFTDPKGNDYRQSPSAFGITFKHFEP